MGLRNMRLAFICQLNFTLQIGAWIKPHIRSSLYTL
jgi:hypothetical protein